MQGSQAQLALLRTGIEQRDAALRTAYAEIASLREALTAQRAALNTKIEDRPLLTRERENLQLISVISTILGYGYNPKERTSAARLLSEATDALGLRLSEDAILGHLQAGAQFLPGDWRDRLPKPPDFKPNSGKRKPNSASG